MKKGPFIPVGKGAPATWALAAPFVPVGVTNRDKRSSFVPVARPGTKRHPLLSRTGVPGWETGTTAVSQPRQINFFCSSGPNFLTKASRKKQNKSYSSYIVRSAFLNTCRESKEGLRVLGIFLIMTKH